MSKTDHAHFVQSDAVEFGKLPVSELLAVVIVFVVELIVKCRVHCFSRRIVTKDCLKNKMQLNKTVRFSVLKKTS